MPVATPLAAGGHWMAGWPTEASPLAVLCVWGKMVRHLTGNASVSEDLWAWLHGPCCKQVQRSERVHERGTGGREGERMEP